MRKTFNWITMHGITNEDENAINRALEDEFELYVDEFNRVWTGQIDGLYIADVEIVDAEDA